MFKELDVGLWRAVEVEQIGSKEKEWLAEPETGARWLWKERTFNADKQGTRYPKGDDWAERVATELGGALGVPVPVVELAKRTDRHGTVSRDFRETAQLELRLGNELLAGANPDYPSGDVRSDPAYTLEATLEVLVDVRPPAPHDLRTTAVDWFVGYLVLDAWIGNSDRHHQNWGALESEEQPGLTLSPSYDHASSMGFLLSDSQRAEHLDVAPGAPGSVEWWADRAPTPFADCRTPLEAAAVALKTVEETVAGGWLIALEGAAKSAPGVLAEVPEPRMSGVAKLFTQRLLEHNAARLVVGGP